jgi:hypothetical protein
LSSLQSAITGALPDVNCSVIRKRLITPISHDAPPVDEGWMELDRAAVVEVTSEEKEYPVESALVSGETQGWRAADSGSQTIRLLFDKPQRLTHISLVFEETEAERTQEFVLRSSADDGRSFREIVRQQWNFSPPATTGENEEYHIALSGVTVLELVIVPDISRAAANASLKSLRLS